jgi:inosine-uridine nucleoside N-ribohydrolase
LHDADDAFALALAFRCPELEILGISATYGNTNLQRALKRVQRLAELGGFPASKVHAGSSSPEDRTARTAAVDALIQVLEGRAEPLTYLALGPLTHLAALTHLRPDLVRHIEQVIFVGGRTPGTVLKIGTACPYVFHDANFEKDPLAVQSVLASGIPITLLPIELSEGLRLKPGHLRTVGRMGGVMGAWLARNGWLWMKQWQWLVWLDGAPVFDVLAVLAAAQPEAVRCRNSRLEIVQNTPEAIPQLHAVAEETSQHALAFSVHHLALGWMLDRLTMAPPDAQGLGVFKDQS